MNILLVYPDIRKYVLYKGTFYTGIASLSAVLKKEINCNVSLLHITKPIKREELLERIEKNKPDLIAFSSTTNMFPYVRLWSEWIKKNNKNIKIICGGVHSTILPEEVITNPNIDIISIGEGEESILELCDKLSKGLSITHIKGLWIKANGDIYKNELRPLIHNLDMLPFPDRTIFDYPNLHTESEGCATVMVSRGCPYVCSYCCNTTLRNIYENNSKYVRFRSVDNAILELKNILQDFPFIKRFNFDDDILPLKRSWFVDFACIYKKDVGLPYECNLHPSLATEEIVRLLKESGCCQVRMGIESGSEFIRKKVLNRNISQEQIMNAFRLCNEVGIKTFSFNMVGLPYEDTKSMLETIKLNAQLNTDKNQITIFYPYPKTEIFDICIKENLIDFNKEVLDYSEDTLLNFKPTKRNQIVFIQKYFRVLVKIYQSTFRLPTGVSNLIETTYDKLIQSNIIASFIMPVMIKLAENILENKFLGSTVRKIYRKLL